MSHVPDSLVAVLLATYNGENYLEEQLLSLAEQEGFQINLYVSDDGSDDTTIDILANFGKRWGEGAYKIAEGPQSGYAENFRSLLTRDDIEGDYVAFCDQDDIWSPDKLTAACTALSAALPGPALYCSRTRLIDARGNEIGFSPLFRRPPSFGNALVQSMGGANTMVMNRAAFELIAESAKRTSFVSHDWWSYIVVSGAGGQILYDPTPHISYRQHNSNVSGKNRGWQARWRRVRQLTRGDFSDWLGQHLVALDSCRDLLTPEALEILKQVRIAGQGNLHERLNAFRRSGIHRQFPVEDVAIFLATVLGRLVR